MSCTCFIVPYNVLDDLSRDEDLSAELRKNFSDTALFTHQLRVEREAVRCVCQPHGRTYWVVGQICRSADGERRRLQTYVEREWRAGAEPRELD